MSRDIPRAGLSVFRGAGALALVLLTWSSACGGDDDGSDVVDSGTGGADGGADAAPLADASTGRATEFVANPAGNIDLVEGVGGPFGVAAALRDGHAVPEATLLASEGPCEIWTHPINPELCDPPCDFGVCVTGNRCEPFPASVDAGDLVVTGLAEELRFEFGKFGYLPPDDVQTEDLFEEGAAISVTAVGQPSLSLSATGVAPLVADLDLEFDVTLVIEDGVDEVIQWTPESSGRVQLALQVGHHGAPYEALLVCEVDDAEGEIVVPGSLITRFPQRSNGLEQHSSWIVRFTRDVIETEAGPVELFVGNRILILQVDHR